MASAPVRKGVKKITTILIGSLARRNYSPCAPANIPATPTRQRKPRPPKNAYFLTKRTASGHLTRTPSGLAVITVITWITPQTQLTRRSLAKFAKKPTTEGEREQAGDAWRKRHNRST